MCIGCSPSLVQPDGSLIKCVMSMKYLSGILSNDTNIRAELGQKNCFAMNIISTNLQRISSYANLSIFAAFLMIQIIDVEQIATWDQKRSAEPM